MERLWVIWKEAESRRRYIIGELKEDNQKYSFKYTNPELDDAKKVGFNNFPGFPDLKKVYKEDSLFANIKTRLPNPKRPDYLEILNYYNLSSLSSDMEILKATKGRLLTDHFEFVPVFTNQDKLLFDIAGTRHHLPVDKLKDVLKINDDLILEHEHDNPSDENAIKVLYEYNNEEILLGYVPRFYSIELAKLLDKNIRYSAKIESLHLESSIYDEYVSVKLIIER